MIIEIAQSYIVRDRYTASYRRIQKKLDQRNAHLVGETIRKLMAQLKVQVAIYNQNRNGKYSSYRGTVEKNAKNLLEQKFDEIQPYKVIHTDSMQTQLIHSDQGWHYQLPYYTQKLADHHFTQTGDSEVGTNQYQGCVNYQRLRSYGGMPSI